MLPGGDVLEHSCIITAEIVCHVCSGTHTYFTPLQYSFQHLCILGFEICVWVETFWKTFTSRERSHFLPELFKLLPPPALGSKEIKQFLYESKEDHFYNKQKNTFHILTK